MIPISPFWVASTQASPFLTAYTFCTLCAATVGLRVGLVSEQRKLNADRSRGGVVVSPVRGRVFERRGDVIYEARGAFLARFGRTTRRSGHSSTPVAAGRVGHAYVEQAPFLVYIHSLGRLSTPLAAERRAGVGQQRLFAAHDEDDWELQALGNVCSVISVTRSAWDRRRRCRPAAPNFPGTRPGRQSNGAARRLRIAQWLRPRPAGAPRLPWLGKAVDGFDLACDRLTDRQSRRLPEVSQAGSQTLPPRHAEVAGRGCLLQRFAQPRWWRGHACR